MHLGAMPVNCCKANHRTLCVYGLGTVLILLGGIALVAWPFISQKIIKTNLVLKNGTKIYDNWYEPPIEIYLEFYMFNWTNPDQIRNPKVKPHFVEMGPYVFLEKRIKQNVSFHDDESLVSYYQKKTWFFDAKRSNGTLKDKLTAAHVITASVANAVRDRNVFIKTAVNFILNHEGGHLAVTRSIGEWIFDGYQDKLIDFLHSWNSTSINIPFKKFGWLVERNGTSEFDGKFTIHTGTKDINKLGQLSLWNGKSETGFFPSPCGNINGTTGDLFPPNMNVSEEVTLFAPDACRFINLTPNGTINKYGIQAIKWIGTNETLDSGENYPSQKCFCNSKDGACPKTGVVSCAKCRNNAQIFASFPHFHLADPSYLNAVSGLHPNASKHTFEIDIEPKTGIPLEINAKFQVNLLIQPDSGIDIYKGVPKFLMPMFWMEQRASLDEATANSAKFIVNLQNYGMYFSCSLIALGASLFIACLVASVAKRLMYSRDDDDDELLIAD